MASFKKKRGDENPMCTYEPLPPDVVFWENGMCENGAAAFPNLQKKVWGDFRPSGILKGCCFRISPLSYPPFSFSLFFLTSVYHDREKSIEECGWVFVAFLNEVPYKCMGSFVSYSHDPFKLFWVECMCQGRIVVRICILFVPPIACLSHDFDGVKNE